MVRGELIRNDKVVIQAGADAGLRSVSCFDRVIDPKRKAFNPSIGKIKMSMSLSSLADQLAGYPLQPFEQRLAALERALGNRSEPLGLLRTVAGHRTHQFYFDRFTRLGQDEASRCSEQAELSEDGHRGAAHNYLTHGLHSYKGKFFPQIVRSLLNVVRVGDAAVIVDPFVGSGTTTLEATVMGFAGHGIDRNPLAALIARTKRSALSLGG